MIIEEEIEELDFELGMLKDQEKDIDTYNQICALIAKCQNLWYAVIAAMQQGAVSQTQAAVPYWHLGAG